MHAPIDMAFLAIAPIDLPSIFRGFGPLPAVVGTRAQGDGWDHVGATRIVELADGSQAREELTAYEAPRHFAYRVSGFTGPVRLVVAHADGAWWFTDIGDGIAHVRWSYVFQPRAGRALLVRALLMPIWVVYQQRALALAVREAERSVT